MESLRRGCRLIPVALCDNLSRQPDLADLICFARRLQFRVGDYDARADLRVPTTGQRPGIFVRACDLDSASFEGFGANSDEGWRDTGPHCRRLERAFGQA